MVLSVKELKSKLEDDELNLSLCELDIVPLREIAQIKKATCLDLSCNRLKFLNDEFSMRLSHLIKLDLSQNLLECLPENFGLLVSLQQLDLYKNRLTNLPFSMENMTSLKFLDISDNPLDSELQNAVGRCMDEKECQKAARLLIGYLRQRREFDESQKENQNIKKRVLHAADASGGDFQGQKNKKKKKKNAKDNAAETPQNRFAGPMHETRYKPDYFEEPDKHRSQPRRRGVCGCCVCMFRWIMILIVSLVAIALLLFWAVHYICSSGSGSVYLNDEQCKQAFTGLHQFEQMLSKHQTNLPVYWENAKNSLLSYFHV